MKKKITIRLSLTIDEIITLSTEFKSWDGHVEDDESEINTQRIKALKYLIKRFDKVIYKQLKKEI